MPKPSSRPQSSPIGEFSSGVLFASVGFLVGTLFMALVTDHGLLYTSQPTTLDAYLRAEHYYLTLWTSPLAVKALFHVILLIPIFTLCIRLARYTESAIYFDGISLGLVLLVFALYTGSTVPNIRKLASAPSTQALADLINLSAGATEFDPSSPISFFNRFLMLLSSPANLIGKSSQIKQSQEELQKHLESKPITDQARKELLSVTAAGHSIALFLLVGIIILQIGKIYAEREDARLQAEFEENEAKKLSQAKKDQ
ncbi:hypothetical protein O181_087104 [Austropuccinia psidii MF-1]|uniref:ER membrane protein SH3 n=1 Tax=Austropuccinia psidii MF-1 TaxID=1389203 RepID=A0A9Q3IP42_9BASI|nr:hypothetical protein [Austropuccinia psidii MF-1]